MNATRLPRLHVITDTRPGASPIPVAAAALQAGARLVQVRPEDHFHDRAAFDLAAAIAELCDEQGALCLVNDRVHIAQAVGADGVHLGDDDLPVDVARRILPAASIVGGTCREPEAARAARRAGATYLGVGPVYRTGTKTGLPDAIGLDGLAAVCEAVDLPVIAIGGITAERARACRDAGAHGVAVVGAIADADDPKRATAELLEAVGVLAMRLAVVGAGSIGLAIAWRAARQGADTTVYDPDPGSGASRVAAGMIAAVTEAQFGEGAMLPFMAESADAWPRFAAELEAASGTAVGYRDVPTVMVGIEDADRAEIDRQQDIYRSTDRNLETLTGRASRKSEPLLSHRARGGVLVPGDHAVDPRAVHRALLEAAEQAGARIRAERIEDPADLEADQVVIAAGCGSARFGLPIRPVRGVVLRLRAPAAQPLPRTTVRAYVQGHPVYIVARESREVLIGATSDERGFDRSTGTAGAVHDLLRRAIAVVPEVAEYHLEEVTVGFRPTAPDNLPLLGRLDECTIAATGHYRHGIALLPGTADRIADLALGVDDAIPKAFDPLRFKEGS